MLTASRHACGCGPETVHEACSLHCSQACSSLAVHMLQVETHEQQPGGPAYHNCQQMCCKWWQKALNAAGRQMKSLLTVHAMMVSWRCSCLQGGSRR